MTHDERRPLSEAAPTTAPKAVCTKDTGAAASWETYQNLCLREASPSPSELTALVSRQVSWWSVHEFVAPMLAAVDPYPAAGTPEWCLLPAGDVRKTMALFDAARHWALRVEVYQAAAAEAAQEISAAADWARIGQRQLIRDSAIAHGTYYIPRVKS